VTTPNNNPLEAVVRVAQKQEWVTPKISLMRAENTDGKSVNTAEFTFNTPTFIPGNQNGKQVGPS